LRYQWQTRPDFTSLPEQNEKNQEKSEILFHFFEVITKEMFKKAMKFNIYKV